MEKKFKPVPDVEALRYKGTPEKPDIKIFVSHRIDQDSEIIDNPLYIPVRCGAVYDEREGVTMLGDDTGDNISEKEDHYGSLSALYWVWRNVESDYYGFCNQGEYLIYSLSDDDSHMIEKQEWKHFSEPFLNKNFFKKYALDKVDKTFNAIKEHDILVSTPISIHENDFVYKYYQSLMYTNNTTDVDLFREVLEKKNKKLSHLLEKYIDSTQFYFYFSFVLKKTYFKEYCNTLFEVLEELENKIDWKYCSKYKFKQFTFFALLLLAAYVDYWNVTEGNQCRVKRLAVVSTDNIQKVSELLPAFSENNIPIVLVCSNEYVPYLSVYFRSLLDHVNPLRNYDIIVLQKQITLENQQKLIEMCSDYNNVSIRFYNPKSRLNNVSFYVAQDAYCEEAYYRLFAPWYMLHYEKAIVMDCDILVRRDLGDLFDIDLEGNYAAGAIDAVFQGMLNGWAAPDTLEYAKNDMKLIEPHNYLNTGVMLFDFNKMRAHFTEEGLISFSLDKQFRCQEQDILNVILEGHVKFLELAWNCYVRTGDFVTYGLKWAPKHVYEEFLQAIENPYLIHFVAYPKPWLDPTVEYAQQFWITARRTPYYETLLFMLTEGRYGAPIFSIRQNLGILDPRSGARKFADKILPKGSKRREFAKILLPKGSLRWRFCKQIYYIFKPEYRPKK